MGEGFDQLEQRLGLSKSSSDKVVGKSDIQDPPQNQIQAIIDLYSRGQFQEVLSQASHLLARCPNSVSLLNVQGASYKGLGKLEKAVEIRAPKQSHSSLIVLRLTIIWVLYFKTRENLNWQLTPTVKRYL